MAVYLHSPQTAVRSWQVLEDGRLTDGKGRTVDFSNTLLILTSNVGSAAILDAIDNDDDGDEAIAVEDDMTITVRSPGGEDAAVSQAVDDIVKGEMAARFRPEFLNRLDQIIVFHPLRRKDVARIAELMLSDVLMRSAEQGVQLKLTPAMRDQLVREGYDAKYGARPLRRAVQRLVEDVAAECMLDGFVGDGGTLEVDLCPTDGDGVLCYNAQGVERHLAIADVQGIEKGRGQAAERPVQGDNKSDMPASSTAQPVPQSEVASP